MRQKWDSIGLHLCKGLLSSGQYLGSNTSLGLRIAGILYGLYAIGTIVENVKTGLKKDLSRRIKILFCYRYLYNKIVELIEKLLMTSL